MTDHPGDLAEDKATLLEIYKTAVEMADRMSARRSGANTFFVTLTTALAAIVGIVSAARKPPPNGSLPSFDAFGLAVTAVAGIVLDLVWWALLRYYRRLSKAKYDVINEIEKRLPAKPYTDEWRLLHPDEPLGLDPRPPKPLPERLRLRVKHREATVVEQVVPFVFVAIYLSLFIRVLVQ